LGIAQKLMQADSIISNTITQDIRLKGHQSIRLTPDGFSVLISDASYSPIVLGRHYWEETVSMEEVIKACESFLDDAGLLTFQGETVLILDSPQVTLVPFPFFNAEQSRPMLELISTLDDSDRVSDRVIRNRGGNLLFAVPEKVEMLGNRFDVDVPVLHTAECLISLADQIRSSDHQRGVVMVEVQQSTLDILVIRGDQIKLLNHYRLNDPSDFIYHTLNTMKQLDLDRESIPVYLSGMVHEEHELFKLLGKYIRNVVTTPYYLEQLDRKDILRFMILSEGSKCV
jgi:hypothetical protein